eukprot:gene32237-54685_t
MLGDNVTCLIDFYFACTDALGYDLAVTHSAWCFTNDGTRFQSDLSANLLRGYDSVHGFDAPTRDALPLFFRGACLRFLLTRCYDWINTPANALVTRKDPLAFLRRLDFYSDDANISELMGQLGNGIEAGNPGPGGWGAVIRYGKHEKEISGGDPDTTNNRMEMWAAIQALTILIEPCNVKLHTDSKYVLDGITKWVHGWQRNGWKNASKQPVRN